ncbi:PaaI family thioesterase [Sneathiella limimaris]|uniref:PaaI family thioesterase n=1 Tax=Sneathiella limimaris TaxID=1964213 RepID=UPI00146EEC6D|nr:PaaI family thioesterase [Sneathiella limimaris]
MTIPDGFSPHFRKSPLTDPWEPLYSRVLEDRVQMGLMASEAHTNSRGFVHGGLLATLADNVMGLSCHVALKDQSGLVTVNLTTDFLSSGRIGQWILFDAHVAKTGKTLCFANCVITADDQIIARAQGIFSNVGSRDTKRG